MNLNLLLIIAVILLGIRLPSFMNRMEMSRADKIKFVIMVFLLLGLAWFSVYVISKFI